MIPGIVSRLSESVVACATTIAPTTDVIVITSTTSTTVLNTITPPLGTSPFDNLLVIVNNSGNAITAVTTGNIATTCSIPSGNMASFIYSTSLGKWYMDKTT